MLYFISKLAWDVFPVRLFSYITFRAIGAAFSAFVISIVFSSLVVSWLKSLQFVSPNRLEGLVEEDAATLARKRDVPSMGGILIIAATVVSVLMWAKLTIPLVWIFVGAFTAFGALGFLDDYLKVVKKDRDGLSSRQKLLGQIVISTVSIYALDHLVETGHFLRQFYVPFWKHPVWQMSLAVTLVWGCLVLISSSNAVNLSDGMDGLATGCMVICALTFAVFAYFCGHSRFADYLNIPFIAGSGEVAIFATAIAGATLGFLWTNCYPAAVFMGDTGSLALGGAIGLIALLVRQELLLVVVGGIFVLEAGSAFLQIGFFKLTRRLTGTPRRLFKCAPIHHHLKQSGWTETQIVIRFWIISAVLAAAGLATLKIR